MLAGSHDSVPRPHLPSASPAWLFVSESGNACVEPCEIDGSALERRDCELDLRRQIRRQVGALAEQLQEPQGDDQLVPDAVNEVRQLTFESKMQTEERRVSLCEIATLMWLGGLQD